MRGCQPVGGRCATHGGAFGFACQTELVLEEVLEERARQFAKYGSNGDIVSGAGSATRWLGPFTYDSATQIEQALRADYEDYEDELGAPTWVHLIREEVAEAFAEGDWQLRRAELLQVAALCVSWVEKMDAGYGR